MPGRDTSSPSVGAAVTVGVSGAAAGQEELDALAPSLRGGWMGMGPKVREFETVFGERLGADFAMTDSGSNALHLAVAALRLPPGSDLVLPAFTWVACPNAVVLSGHRPVFADVDPATGNVDASLVERALTPRTGAVMVVHYAGKPVDVDAVAALGLPLIEDAAHAVDSALDGRPCGTLGDVGVFSFDAVKNVATPDGGGVTSPSPEVMERARRLRYCGIGHSGFDRSGEGGRWWEHDDVDVFPRAIPNDVSASIGLVQLRRLERHQAVRRAIWRRYDEAFADLPWLETPAGPSPRERHSYFTYLVRVVDGRRDELAHCLLDAGIYTTLRYAPLYRSPVFGSNARLPGCELLAEQGLNLPLHPRLTDADVDRVIEQILSF